MKYFITLLLLLISLASFAKKGPYKTEILVNQEDVIWGFDFFSDGRVIFTERGGKLFVYDPKTKKLAQIQGVPKVHAVGQGGLLDVRVHPKNGYIYLTYSEPVKDEATTALARGKIEGNNLVDLTTLFSAKKPGSEDIHFGSRIEFDQKGHVYITVGDRNMRPLVQKLDTHIGKVIRLNEDGSIPKDNPYVNEKGAMPEVYARGIRSPQGLMFRPGTDELWESEMGPRGGDELNIIEAKKNYGWPDVTYGREYYGPKIGKEKAPGTEEPIVHWVPSISPSAMTFYTGDKIPEWKGNIFLGTLSGQHLRRLEVSGRKITKQEELFKDLDYRWRNVRTGPDGYLWFSTDEGKIGRITK